jgi:hypothetical protein
MFRTGSFTLRFLLALVLLAGLVGAVAFAFRAGYSQGYVIGAAADGEAPQFAPGYRMYPGMMPYFGMHFFPPIGLFFCGLPLLFVALLAAIFRPRHWHHHPAWAGHGGPHHWSHEHPCGPDHASQTPPAHESKSEDNPPTA